MRASQEACPESRTAKSCWLDGLMGKNAVAKPGNLSLIPGPHIVGVENGPLKVFFTPNVNICKVPASGTDVRKGGCPTFSVPQ